MFRENMVDLPIIIGNLENANERAQLEAGLRGMNLTLADVQVITIDDAEARGLFQNQRFLQYIGMMGFQNAAQMRAAAELAQQRGGGNVLGGGGNQQRPQNNNQPQQGGQNLLDGWQ
jgi:hypothetical protein